MSSEGVEKEVVGGNEFYDKAKEYWSNIQPTVDGVLGGFGHISQSDITGSEQFLRDVFKLDRPPGRGRALDCGAGIGRVTKHLLANFFAKVDLVDQNKDFVNKATEYVGEIPQIGNLYVAGLQEFQPTEKYDVIWCQWVLGHLTDDHLVEFFMKCQNCLAERGMIVIKENHTSSGEVDVDEETGFPRVQRGLVGARTPLYSKDIWRCPCSPVQEKTSSFLHSILRTSGSFLENVRFGVFERRDISQPLR
ncbi:hypothetical protein GE061_009712 [Apolygus lucorum]|uniref:Alpha N-terminal protein methyltransferase 1 n=1 Tax=Apolygus lucorum TaxID=248454 RepID=A0A8S9Y1A4_APOLU|nr:hypothetical protein GE061_009712 [Apolygus lucorum]